MFKLLSINLDGYSAEYGAWPIRIGLIRELIEDACPDVIALQSVAKDASVYFGEDQATQIAALFKVFPNVAYQKNGESGLAIIAREPFEILPAGGGEPRPGWMGTAMTINQARLNLANVSFSPAAPGSAESSDRPLADFISKEGYAVLVGCLGQPPQPGLLAALEHAGWYDVWADVYGAEAAQGLRAESDGAEGLWASQALRPFVHSLKRVAEGPFTSAARPVRHASLLLTLAGLEKAAI
jgi:hypothetical protein